MSIAHQNVALAVHKARDQAKTIFQLLESQVHPQTGQSSALYLALVLLEKRLRTVDPPPPPIAQLIPETGRAERAPACEYGRCGGLGQHEVKRKRRARETVRIGAQFWRVCESWADLLLRAAGAEGHDPARVRPGGG